MSHADPLFHIIHVMFSYGITRPKMAKTLEELKELIKFDKDADLKAIMDNLIAEGYVSSIDNRFFLLGKGIIAVAAIFT